MKIYAYKNSVLGDGLSVMLNNFSNVDGLRKFLGLDNLVVIEFVVNFQWLSEKNRNRVLSFESDTFKLVRSGVDCGLFGIDELDKFKLAADSKISGKLISSFVEFKNEDLEVGKKLVASYGLNNVIKNLKKLAL